MILRLLQHLPHIPEGTHCMSTSTSYIYTYLLKVGVDFGVVCVLLLPVMLALRNDCPPSEGLPDDTLGVTNIYGVG